MSNGALTMSNRVVLVHGTFAKDADWTREGSKLVKAIRQIEGSELISFSWSGKNSHRARKIASDELADLLKNDAILHPDAKRTIVAHSHGGNIALRALRQVEDEVEVDDLICLGTPFLICNDSKSSSIGLVLKGILGLLFFSVFAVPLLYLAFFVLIALAVDDLGPAWAIGSTLLFCITLVLSFVVPRYLVRRISRHIVARHRDLAEDLDWPKADATAMLNYQVSRDEAYFSVSTLSWLGQLPVTLWNYLERFASKFIWFSFVLGMIAVAAFDIIGNPAHWALNIFVTPFAVVSLSLILLIPLTLLAVLTPLLRSLPIAFGWEGLTQHFIYDVVITSDPMNYWRGELRSEKLLLDPKLWRVRHSAFYDDDTVVSDIVSLIRS